MFFNITTSHNSEQPSLLVLSCGKFVFHEKHYLSGDFAVRFAATKACSRNVIGNQSDELVKNIKLAILSANKKYNKELGSFGIFFVLSITITNLIHRLFGFTLLPIFQVGFDAMHEFCRFILQTFVFSWVLYILESICYFILKVLSFVCPIIPYWPKFIIPHIIIDFILVSLAITRVFQSADFIIPRNLRQEAEELTTEEEWEEIRISEGYFFGIHRFIERINFSIWAFINKSHGFLSAPFRNKKTKAIIYSVVITFFAAITMWGFIRLIGYTINTILARKLSSQIMIIRKQLMKHFILHLIAALLTSFIFILLNGWIAEWIAPKN